MRINYIKGDLLSVTSGLIVHGCNAQGVMGSGVALAVRHKYPKAYNDYRTAIFENFLGLGEVQFVKVSEGLYLCNAVTQEFYGRDNKVYVSYEAIWSIFQAVFSLATHGYTVSIPKIGAGLGGGDWDRILQIIKEQAKEQGYNGVLNVYEL
jgi:O-acetyl-ADP-ribose deacetylase (regulator of RNase III)